MIVVIGAYHGGTSAAMAALQSAGVNIGDPKEMVTTTGPGYPCYENLALQTVLKQCWKEGPMTPRGSFADRCSLLRQWLRNHGHLQAIKHPLLSLMQVELETVFGKDLEVVRVLRPHQEVVAALKRDGGFWPEYYESMTRTLIDSAALFQRISLEVEYSNPDFAETIRHFGRGERNPFFFKLLATPRMFLRNETLAPNHNSTVGLADFIANEVPETGSIVEIGVARGVSTAMFAAMRPEVQITAIDREIQLEARDLIKPYGDRVELVQGGALKEAHRHERHSLDGVYLDHDHTKQPMVFAIRDWFGKVKPGGFIGGHDYQPDYPGVMQAVIESFGRLPDRVYADGSWVIRKRNGSGGL